MTQYQFLRCCFFLAFLFAQINFQAAFAIDNDQEDRAAVVAPRNDRFYNNDRLRQYLNFTGEYESDQNSKQYVVTIGHFYRSKKLINEIDFLYQQDYAQKAKDNYHLAKSSELYDFQIATKALIPDTQDYLVFYNRSKYNEFSSYYYDITTAAGVGRMFFDDRLEIDVTIGRSETQNSSKTTTFIPSFRAEFDVYQKWHFIQRGFMFFSDQAQDYQLRSRLQYPISPRLYLQVTYDNDKRRYVGSKAREKVNEVHRRILFGFRYDLGSDF